MTPCTVRQVARWQRSAYARATATPGAMKPTRAMATRLGATMSGYDYDVLVIGSGPSGQRAAIQSAKLHKRVAIIERKAVVGGVCVNSGTIPSKTMREAALHLSGYRYRSLYGASYSVKQNITMADLLFRTGHVVNNEIEVMRH